MACPSSCDWERAMSTLSKIVTALRNRMTWSNIRMHLIRAEDIDPNIFDFELVARLWAATPSRRVQYKERRHGPAKRKY